MSLERELAHADYQIDMTRASIETAYALDLSEDEKDAAFGRLVHELRARDLLRLRYVQAVRWQQFAASATAALRKLTKALVDFANKPEIQRLIADLKRLEGEHKRSTPAFWRGVVDCGSRLGGPSPAFAAALPANRRPVLPGHMKQKGRG